MQKAITPIGTGGSCDKQRRLRSDAVTGILGKNRPSGFIDALAVPGLFPEPDFPEDFIGHRVSHRKHLPVGGRKFEIAFMPRSNLTRRFRAAEIFRSVYIAERSF